MRSEDAVFRARMLELSDRTAAQSCYQFTDFLNPAERSVVLECERELAAPVSFCGGYPQAERVMARFGSVQDLGYEADYPIAVLKISPRAEKFSDTFTHRDFLGALLNLGIDRRCTGDILTDGTRAYVYVTEQMAPFLQDMLIRVKHTAVFAERVRAVPDMMFREPQTVFPVVPSLRPDAVIAKIYGLSRKEVQTLFAAEKVFVNHRLQGKASQSLQEGDLVSVRGYGRFRFVSAVGDTRKGNLRIEAEKY